MNMDISYMKKIIRQKQQILLDKMRKKG